MLCLCMTDGFVTYSLCFRWSFTFHGQKDRPHYGMLNRTYIMQQTQLLSLSLSLCLSVCLSVPLFVCLSLSRTHTCTLTCTRTHAHMHTHTPMDTSTHACTHTRTHTCTHTHSEKHKYIDKMVACFHCTQLTLTPQPHPRWSCLLLYTISMHCIYKLFCPVKMVFLMKIMHV